MSEQEQAPKPIPAFVRAMLQCPRCRGDLVDADGELQCLACRVAWPVRDGVPWIVPEHARRLDR